MSSFKLWLKNSNGWQRIWVVFTLVSLVYFGFFQSLKEAGEASTSRYAYDRAAYKDFDNPLCKEYLERPIKELREPKYEPNGGSCWHIYTHRSFLDKDEIPLTRDKYDRNNREKWWEQFLLLLAIYSTIVLVLSGLVYGSGVVISWIIKGFKKE